jgi:hypothetical protein
MKSQDTTSAEGTDVGCGSYASYSIIVGLDRREAEFFR